jgi:hypothetical protein
MAGDEGRPTLAPLAAAPLSGEEGRGEDYSSGVSIEALNQQDSDGGTKVAAHHQQLATLAMVASRPRAIDWPNRRDGFRTIVKNRTEET